MRQTISAIILLLLVSVSVFAQDETIKSNDEKAKAILDKVSEKYKTYKSIQADFSLNIVNEDADVDETKTGKFFVQGSKYKLDMDEQMVVCDNETQWTYLKEANEVQITYYDEEEASISPSQLFTIYEDDYFYVWHSDSREDGSTYDLIDLTPFDKDQPFYKVRISVNRESDMIEGAKLFTNDGTYYIYKITELLPDGDVSDDTFTFDDSAYEGIEVIDLR